MFNFSLSMVKMYPLKPMLSLYRNNTYTKCVHFPETLECLSSPTAVGEPQLTYWNNKLDIGRSKTLQPGLNIRTSRGLVDSTAGWCVSPRLTGHGVRTQRPERSPLTSTTADCNPGTTIIEPHSDQCLPFMPYGSPKLLLVNQIVQC